MKRIFFILAAVLFLALPTMGFSEPTPVVNSVYFDEYTDPKGVGFYLYYASEDEDPRVYDDSRKIDLAFPSSSDVRGDGILRHTIVILDVHPGAKASLCLKLTAYDSVGRESNYSEELCGWFGLTRPAGMGIK